MDVSPVHLADHSWHVGDMALLALSVTFYLLLPRNPPRCACVVVGRTPVRGDPSCSPYGRLFLQWVRIFGSRGRAVRWYLGTPDNHHEEFVGADKRDRWPRGHQGTDGTVPQAVGRCSRPVSPRCPCREANAPAPTSSNDGWA